MTAALIIVALLGYVYFVIFAVLFYLSAKSAHRRGYEEGFTAGHKKADDWWIGTEEGAREVREKIGTEEEEE